MLCGQLSCATQLRLAGGGRKTRRDGVAQAVHTVPAPDQLFGFIEALLDAAVAQSVGAVTVLQYPSAQHTQLAFLGFLEKGIYRHGVRGGKAQGRGHTVAQQFIEKEACHFMRMGGVSESHFLREGVVVQPRQQAVGG